MVNKKSNTKRKSKASIQEIIDLIKKKYPAKSIASRFQVSELTARRYIAEAKKEMRLK